MEKDANLFDAIIVGGGPAGLNAALVLGRCRRKVLLCDAGRGRNWASQGVHGFLSRDGTPPSELRALGREQLKPYEVHFCDARVLAVERVDGLFEATIDGGSRLRGRKLLLATGVVDRLPLIPRVEEYYGRSVFHCPYCDGWEVRDQPVAVYGRAVHGFRLALSMKSWSADLILFTDGPARLPDGDRARLAANGIGLREEKIAGLDGTEGMLQGIELANGERVPRRALFFSTMQVQRSQLPGALGCTFNSKGTVRTSRLQEPSCDGIYVAGDASRDVQMAIVAAAEGAKAAVAINTALQKEELA